MALQGSSDVEHEAGGAGHVPQRLLHAGLLRLGVPPQVLALHGRWGFLAFGEVTCPDSDLAQRDFRPDSSEVLVHIAGSGWFESISDLTT